MTASPCTGICQIEPVTGLCGGCGRTLDEIARWSGLGEADQERIVAAARERYARTSPGETSQGVRP